MVRRKLNVIISLDRPEKQTIMTVSKYDSNDRDE